MAAEVTEDFRDGVWLVAEARSQLGNAVFAGALLKGRGRNMDEAIAHAMGNKSQG